MRVNNRITPEDLTKKNFLQLIRLHRRYINLCDIVEKEIDKRIKKDPLHSLDSSHSIIGLTPDNPILIGEGLEQHKNI